MFSFKDLILHKSFLHVTVTPIQALSGTLSKFILFGAFVRYIPTVLGFCLRRSKDLSSHSFSQIYGSDMPVRKYIPGFLILSSLCKSANGLEKSSVKWKRLATALA